MDDRGVIGVAADVGRDDGVEEAAQAAAGRPGVGVAEAGRTPLAAVTNLTTERIDRVAGTLEDGTPFSIVAKVLRPASRSPIWAEIPEEFHEEVLATLPWLAEPHLYRCGLAERLPDGIRMPRLLGVHEEPERLVLWLEDVADATTWDLARHRRAARALGRMAGRFPGQRAAEELGLGPMDLRSKLFGEVAVRLAPLLAGDALWQDPAVAGAVDPHLRRDLARLLELGPALLARLDGLPVGLCHGDACPANLLEPSEGDVVAIDWSYGQVGAIGSDLAQLLAGRYDSGHAEVEDLEPVAGAIQAAHLEGLAEEGCHPHPGRVATAFAVHLVVRSAFSAVVVPPDPDGDQGRRADLLRRRAAFARFAVDLGLVEAGR